MNMNFDIQVLKRKALIKYPFFGSIIANVEYKDVGDVVQIAQTDGKTIYYNSNYMNQLDINKQMFVLAHEICHIAFNHIERAVNKNIEIWNIATDAIINAFLKKDGNELIDGIIDIEGAIEYDAEQLYEIIMYDIKKYEKYIIKSNHNMWKKREKPNNEIIKKQEELKNKNEAYSFKKNIDERKKQLQELKDELKRNNFISQESERKIEIVEQKKSLIDWRYILKETINYEVDWSYEDASIEYGILTPNLVKQFMPSTEIVIDTSGSINEILLRNFLRECKNILKHSIIRVGCFDTKFYGFTNILCNNDIDNLIILGGGGTDFKAAVDAFSPRTENKIIFTDGKATMPKKEIDAIWIVYGNTKIVPKGGKVIYIDQKMLCDLMVEKGKIKIIAK